MLDNADVPMVCPNCRTNVALKQSSIPDQISAAMRLRLNTFGTQVQCPHCRQPFVHRAHPIPAPIGIAVQNQRVT